LAVGLLLLLVALPGCHRVIIDSGLEPAPEIYPEEWNLAFAAAIYPARVDASQWCGGRYARVETQQSFLNGVVAAITSSIITPMDVRVTCAAGGPESDDRGPPAPEDDAKR
jgi:hypothetical protein